MKERPILFQGAMVRALLAGTKTQTRRVVKPQPVYAGGSWKCADGSVHQASRPSKTLLASCPYGRPGDRLWVRETFFAFGRWETRFSAKKGRDEWHFLDMTAECGHWYFYGATSKPETVGSFRRSGVTPMWWKRPAIHMPRAANRTLLDVTDVRVERLQTIGDRDAQAEGIVQHADGHGWHVEDGRHYTASPVDSYASLWETINGSGSWEANPWVWVVEFRKVQPC